MIAGHVLLKTLRESIRQPLYLATLLGIPFALMIIFGAALSGYEPVEAQPAERSPWQRHTNMDASGEENGIPLLEPGHDGPTITDIRPAYPPDRAWEDIRADLPAWWRS